MSYRSQHAAEADQHGHADDWLMTYADMITLLLCFFVIFLIVTLAKKDGPHKAMAEKTVVESQVQASAKGTSAPTQEELARMGWKEPFQFDKPFRELEPDDFVDGSSPSRNGDASGSSEETLPLEQAATHRRPLQDTNGLLVDLGPTKGESIAPPLVPTHGHADTAEDSSPAIAAAPPGPAVASDAVGPVPVLKGDRIQIIEMDSSAFFGRASAAISAKGSEILKSIAARLLSKEYDGYRITVEGHTDDTPIRTKQFPSNWELSTARASAVVHTLIKDGVMPQRLRAAGYADTMPKLPNRDATGKALPSNQAHNRRVVIKLEKIEKVAATGTQIAVAR